MRDRPFKDFSVREDVKEFKFWRAVIAEFCATFFLCLSVLSTTYALGTLGIAVAFGFSIVVLIQAVGDISGGHMNNAVSFGLFLSGKISLFRCLFYTGAQVGGAIVAVLLCNLVINEDSEVDKNWGYGLCVPSVDKLWVLVMEILFTALLVHNVLMSTEADKPSHDASLKIGLTVFLAHVILVPLTGSSLNPARATGSAVIAGEFDDLWMYWISGYAGGALGAVTYWVFSP